MKKEIYSCDISNREHAGTVKAIPKLQVIFDHDQEDGKSKCELYLHTVTVDMCDECLKFMLRERKYIYAYGAMGYNKYSL